VKSAISTHVLNFGHFDLPVLRSPQGEGWVSDLGLELGISLLLPNSLPNKMIRSKPILVHLRRHHLATHNWRLATAFALYICRISSTNSPLLCKTNPISKNTQIDVSPVSTIGYEKTSPSADLKTNPKRTQTNPKQTQFLARQGLPKPKRTQTNPTSSEPAEPVYPGAALLLRRSPVRCRDGEARSNPISKGKRCR
jgi:hypothetical protein